MHADLATPFLVGILVVLAAIAALTLLVRRDLAPAGAFGGALDGGGRWFLGGALGLGVIAFTIKLAILAILANFPTQTIAPLIGPPPVAETPPPTAAPLPDMEQALSPPIVAMAAGRWRPLPATPPHPADNPPNAAKVALGQRLFNDPNLSADRNLACAGCHDLSAGAGADGRPTARGIGGAIGARNTPSVVNAAFQARLFWDGRAASLEEQALGPLFNPIEMGMASPAQVEDRLRADPTYGPAFAAAFGDTDPRLDRAAQAIAAYERTLVSADSPYDRFVAGDPSALDDAQKRGLWLFDSLGCAACHSGPNFSGASLVGPRNPYARLNTARLPAAQAAALSADKGRAAADQSTGVWRVPSLRNVALTAPYFHDGSLATLDEAVRVMAVTQLGAVIAEDGDGASETTWWDARSAAIGHFAGKRLSRRDVADLVAFLHALSGDALVSATAQRRRSAN